MKHPDFPWAIYINTGEFQCPEFDIALRGVEMSCKVPAFCGQKWQYQLHVLGLEEDLTPDSPVLEDEPYTVESWVNFALADCFPVFRGEKAQCIHGPHPGIITSDVSQNTVSSIRTFEILFKIFEGDRKDRLLFEFRFDLTEPVLASMTNCPTMERLAYYRRRDQLVVPASKLPARESFLGIVGVSYVPRGPPFNNCDFTPMFYLEDDDKKDPEGDLFDEIIEEYEKVFGEDDRWILIESDPFVDYMLE